MNQNGKNVNVRQKKRKNKTTKTGTKKEKIIVLYEKKTKRDDKLTGKKMKTRQEKKNHKNN